MAQTACSAKLKLLLATSHCIMLYCSLLFIDCSLVLDRFFPSPFNMMDAPRTMHTMHFKFPPTRMIHFPAFLSCFDPFSLYSCRWPNSVACLPACLRTTCPKKSSILTPELPFVPGTESRYNQVPRCNYWLMLAFY